MDDIKALSECKWKVEIVGIAGAYSWKAHTSEDNGSSLLSFEQNGSCELRWGAKRNWIRFAKLNNFKKYVTWHIILKKYVY